MTRKDPTQTTGNAGPLPGQKRTNQDEFDVTGNLAVKGQDPSPDNRRRGEVSDKESTAS
jgi:hypothetical protein